MARAGTVPGSSGLVAPKTDVVLRAGLAALREVRDEGLEEERSRR
jgi:hypothetical protein